MKPWRNKTTCTIPEAMEIAHVSRRTIYYWIAKGKLQVLGTCRKPRLLVDQLLTEDAPVAQEAN